MTVASNQSRHCTVTLALFSLFKLLIRLVWCKGKVGRTYKLIAGFIKHYAIAVHSDPGSLYYSSLFLAVTIEA